MKYLIVVPDGSADDPIDSLGGRTPLEAADLSTIDMLASKGERGFVKLCLMESVREAIRQIFPLWDTIRGNI